MKFIKNVDSDHKPLESIVKKSLLNDFNECCPGYIFASQGFSAHPAPRLRNAKWTENSWLAKMAVKEHYFCKAWIGLSTKSFLQKQTP